MKLALFAILTVPLFALPCVGLAHTSDERYVNGVIVDLSTAPIAPWAGEKVGFLFSFLDPATFQVIDTIRDAKIEIIATFRENGKPQEVIYTSEILPVNRGTLNFSYTFEEVGTYDVHISFTNTKGETLETGYRRQIRTGATEESGHSSWQYQAMLVLLGAAGGTLFARAMLQRKSVV